MQIDENKRPRSALKTYFAKNAIPTDGQFAQLIESAINQRDDGVVKNAGDPLSIEATGDDVGLKRAINFYNSFADADPAWTISLRPRSKPSDPNTGRPGWSVSDAAGNSQLCIDITNGNVGIGTIAPAEKLEVTGCVRAGTVNVGPWPANPGRYCFFGSSGLNHTNAGNYALLQDNGDGTTFLNSPTMVHVRIGNVDRMTVDNDGVTVVGSLKAAGSAIYFTETAYKHTGFGDLPGCAAIENSKDFGGLMILGRNMGAPGGPLNRVVKLWDLLDVYGDIRMFGQHAFRGNDGWLRLNQEGAFVHGTHTPGLFAPMSVNVGGANGWEFNPGNGNIIYAGTLSKLDVGPTFTAVVRCADFTIGGISGRRASPGRAIVDLGDTLCLNFGPDWPNTNIDGQCKIFHLLPVSSGALKKDVQPMSSAEAAAIVNGLDPVTFRWKKDDSARHLGFIAEKCPEAVTSAERDAIFIVDIVAALTRVVRDQAKTIASLERRLDGMPA